MADLAASWSGAWVRAESPRLRSFDTTDVKCACKWRASRNGWGGRDVEAGGRRGAFSLTSVTDDAATENLWKAFGERPSFCETGGSGDSSKSAATRGGGGVSMFQVVDGKGI